jgi:hypothetical protein
LIPAQDWRKELQNDPRVQELHSTSWGRLRQLGSDKEFVDETLRLKSRLEKALKDEPEIVKHFFSSFKFATGLHLGKVKRFLRTVKNKDLKQLLKRYCRYAARFRCGMYIRTKSPRFRVMVLPSKGSRFSAKISRGHLQPTAFTTPGEPFLDAFESQSLKIPAALKELERLGKGRFVHIDDQNGSSVLSELENASYDPDGLTFVVHEAEQPYILCLIGENAGNQVWRDAASTVRELQRIHFGRERAGKPVDIRQRLKVAAAMRKPGPSKVHAVTVAKTGNSGTAVTAYSKLKAKLT